MAETNNSSGRVIVIRTGVIHKAYHAYCNLHLTCITHHSPSNQYAQVNYVKSFIHFERIYLYCGCYLSRADMKFSK